MKILYIAAYRLRGEDAAPTRLVQCEDLTSFSIFQRGVVREQLVFATRTFSQRVAQGQRAALGLDKMPFKLYIHSRSDGLCGCLVADEEYPQRVAFAFIGKFMGDLVEKYGVDKLTSFSAEDVQLDLPNLENDFRKYQDPKEADKLSQIQKNLDDVKEIMQKNIEEVLKRGETLDSLMMKSNDLSKTSVTFYQTAKKNNQCCQLY